MKKVIYLFLTLIALSVYSCGSDCSINKPKNLKSIDWEGWNDVYTVYWNGVKLCNDPAGEMNGKTVKVYGWIPWSYDLICLCDDSTATIKGKQTNLKYVIGIDNTDIVRTANKYYVVGRIAYSPCPESDFCKSGVIIIADSIYFVEK